HSSQIRTPCSWRYLIFVSPARNQSSSYMIDFRWSFFVVSRGNPSSRANRIWCPNTDNVPVPVRSRFSTPRLRISSIKSRYWRIFSNIGWRFEDGQVYRQEQWLTAVFNCPSASLRVRLLIQSLRCSWGYANEFRPHSCCPDPLYCDDRRLGAPYSRS